MVQKIGVENKLLYFVEVFETGFEALHFDFEFDDAQAVGAEVGNVSAFKGLKLLFKGGNALFKLCDYPLCNLLLFQFVDYTVYGSFLRFEFTVNSWCDHHETLSAFALHPRLPILLLSGHFRPPICRANAWRRWSIPIAQSVHPGAHSIAY